MLSSSTAVIPEFRSSIWLVERNPLHHRYVAAEIRSILESDPQLSDNLGFGREDIAAVADESAGKSSPDIIRAIIGRWFEQRSLPKPEHTLVKLGRMVDFGDALLAADDDIAILFLVRDPRAVVRSMATSKPPRDTSGGSFSRGSHIYSAKLWRSRFLAYNRIASRYPDRSQLVRFEDLDDPSTTQLILDFVGRTEATNVMTISAAEQTLHNNVGREFDRSLNDQWRGQLSNRTVRQIEMTCRSHMEELGYPLAEATSPSLLTRADFRVSEVLSKPISQLRRGRTVLSSRRS